jgi:hypothetical protein
MKRESTKTGLHPRNRFREGYDFTALIAVSPALKAFVKPNAYGDDSIDYADPLAVKALNQALLRQAYGLPHWDIPAGYLCPPIPGRSDYLHHLADLIHLVVGLPFVCWTSAPERMASIRCSVHVSTVGALLLANWTRSRFAGLGRWSWQTLASRA